MPKIIEFNHTPTLTREYVNNWLAHARQDGEKATPVISVLEDVVKLIDVALTVLKPGRAEPEKNN